MKLLALTKYGPEAASTRQRFLQYAPSLQQAGFELDIAPLLGDDHVRRIAKGRGADPFSVMRAYAARRRTLTKLAEHECIGWIHCETFPYAPAFVERWAACSAVPYVFDYDDAIFHMYDRNPLLRDKLEPLIAGAAAVTAGNAYLADYAGRWNVNVHVVPTTVDTDAYVPAVPRHVGPPVIGWIGSPSTWAYVRPYLPLLADLCTGSRARFLAVGAGRAAEADRFDGMETREWAEHREIADVQAMDIGLMPLPDEPWARGKCGYKLIQYMACGLPTIASPVGVNANIVIDGKTGFLASSPCDWRTTLQHFIDTPADRTRLGTAGRARAVAHYSLVTWAPRIVDLFLSVANR